MRKPKRVVLLGLDGMVPTLVERFMREGALPRLQDLAQRGGFSRMLSVIPAQTPSNWQTIATGATPGTHGIVHWGNHFNGEPVWETHHDEAFTAGACSAEYIWEAAARSGKRSVVVNYAGYPPTTSSAVFIDWLYQPTRSYFDLSRATVHHNIPDLNTQDPLTLSKARGWESVPSSKLPPLEAEVPVTPATKGKGPTYRLLLIARSSGYDTALLCPANDAGRAAAELSVGKWSDWITGDFQLEGETIEAAFRFKLLELSPDGRRIRLYRSDAFPTDGRFCSHKPTARKLMAGGGPYLHAGGACGLHVRGLIDWQTMDEILRDEREWWASGALLAMESTRASLLVLHWHLLDEIGHDWVPRIDPTGRDYVAEKAAHYWALVKDYYIAADRFVGAFLDSFDDGNTVFTVVSDHGMPANTHAVSLVNLFKPKGWIGVKPGGKEVDWTESAVFFSQNHLWINLKGRDRDGIVDPGGYRAMRSEIIAMMRDLKNPETGEHVFAFVLPREDAPVVGLWGDAIGDVVYCYSGGYRWSGPEVLRMGEKRLVFPSGGGNHGPMMPTYETEVASVMASLFLAGPGVRKGVRVPRSVQARISTTDIAPTLAWFLGIPAPAQSEGRILNEFVEDLPAEPAQRESKPMARVFVPRPSVKPQPVKLQGDVTDEEET